MKKILLSIIEEALKGLRDIGCLTQQEFVDICDKIKGTVKIRENANQMVYRGPIVSFDPMELCKPEYDKENEDKP